MQKNVIDTYMQKIKLQYRLKCLQIVYNKLCIIINTFLFAFNESQISINIEQASYCF